MLSHQVEAWFVMMEKVSCERYKQFVNTTSSGNGESSLSEAGLYILFVDFQDVIGKG
jgi:hypothetical protein